jgi:hypothetical protein
VASSSQNDVQLGRLNPQALRGDYNAQHFMVQALLSRIQTATLVKIVSCTRSGAVDDVGFVDVLPLVNAIDGQGNSVPHTTIHTLPYFRLQGGANAIIIDPQPGDIGIAVFASRDISKVKTTKKQANPGSYRQYSWMDGLYLGGVLNGVPSQFVEFSAAGIRVHSPIKIAMDAPEIDMTAPVIKMDATTSVTMTTPTFTINGNTNMNGTLTQAAGSSGGTCTMVGPLHVTNDVTAGSISLKGHTHGGVTSGGASTGGPQ